MKRVLLDTNVYGELVERGDSVFVSRLVERGFAEIFVICGNAVIRKELREIPKKEEESRKFRLAVLSLYDVLVGSRSFQLTNEEYTLANSYLKIFKELKQQLQKRKASDEKICNDFLIIASATEKGMDIVYSSDVKTMFSEEARKAYTIVNDIKKLRTPTFKTYEDFIKEVKRCET